MRVAGTPGTALGALDRLLGSVTRRHQHPAGKITDLQCSGSTTTPVRDTWLLWVLYNNCFPGPATDRGAAHRYKSRAHHAPTLCFTRFLTISNCVCINIHGKYILQIYIYIHTHQYTYSNLKLYIPYRYRQIQNEGGRTVLTGTPAQSSWFSERQAEGFGG